MFDEWKKRRHLRKEINSMEKEKFKLDELINKKEIGELNSKISSSYLKLDTIVTDRLLEKANQLGIEIPLDKNNWWWDNMDYINDVHDFRQFLTDIGKAGVSKLIREEKRRNIEWWVKIIITIFTALTGLIGSIIGVLSVLRK